jgi:hypothetical protein
MNTIAENAPERETHQGYAMHHVPTWTERLRRALGFRFHYGEEPEGGDDLPGWMCTEVGINFGILDRLRLLTTGRLHLRLIQHTPVQCDFSKNRIDWQIKAPSER